MDDPRELVALGCRVLAHGDQGDFVWGHLSARDPQGRGVWMKAAGYGFEEVTAERVVLVGWDGAVLAGDERRHAEYPIHTEVAGARDDVGAVVHTHSAAAVALGATGAALRPVSHEGTLFTPPDVPRFTDTGDLILTRELGRALAACLGGRNAALMVNHGVVVAAADVATAVITTLLLDRACDVQLRVMAAGGPVHYSSDDEARSKRVNCYDDALLRQAWDYLVRRVATPAA